MISGWGRVILTHRKYARPVPSWFRGASFRSRLCGRFGRDQRVLRGRLEQEFLRKPRPQGVAGARDPAPRIVLFGARLGEKIGPDIFAAVIELPALLIDHV